MDNRLAREVGTLLRTTRERRGMAQARLAARAGASQQWLSQVERGAVNPTLGDLERFFAALGMRLRVEAAPTSHAAHEDPELILALPDEDRQAMVSGYGYVLRKLADVPLQVGGRLAALAHGLPVRVRRLDLILTHADRQQFASALRRFGALRWNERWQEFRDHSPADQPGPMRWLIGTSWEINVSLVDELPPAVDTQLGDLALVVPPLPWLTQHDADVGDLVRRLPATER